MPNGGCGTFNGYNDTRKWNQKMNQKCIGLARPIVLIMVAAGFCTEAVAIQLNPAVSPPPLQRDAEGEWVESLQRTLNARLTPSPNLSIDGSFGPNTERAVRLFQGARDLKITGRVDRTTWMALGTLITQDEVIDDVDQFNRERLPQAPYDGLKGMPFLTCKAWVIADARTGKVLWGDNHQTALDTASTTKIMTAYLVLSLARQHPEILREDLVFSERADRTPGSTAGVRQGERISIGELLYGLLLPSGNDASVALAEHFGGRLHGNTDAVAEESYDLFIQTMNATAEDLGMEQSHFENPHGLTAKGHQLSASDLVKLAHAAFQMPLFRDYVMTRQHAVRVTAGDGSQRVLRWKNTNRLLGISGYDGVKTGTTTAAGACLVSHGVRGSQELFVVVLGASGSSARYADSRNLYRWAWNQLQRKKGLRRNRQAQ